jgi:dATP/dGTP diphosphohydrolase
MNLSDLKIGQKVVALDNHWMDRVRRKVGIVAEVDFDHVGVSFPGVLNNLIVYSDVCELMIVADSTKPMFPHDAGDRKKIPLASGVLDYFPSALIEIAKVSQAGNDQHNHGQPLHWARAKSTDQDDTIMRHFMERGKFDTDGQRHSAKLAWRALALLQLELEAEGAPMARGAK